MFVALWGILPAKSVGGKKTYYRVTALPDTPRFWRGVFYSPSPQFRFAIPSCTHEIFVCKTGRSFISHTVPLAMIDLLHTNWLWAIPVHLQGCSSSDRQNSFHSHRRFSFVPPQNRNIHCCRRGIGHEPSLFERKAPTSPMVFRSEGRSSHLYPSNSSSKHSAALIKLTRLCSKSMLRIQDGYGNKGPMILTW